jgi:hypothetical protein
VSDSVYQSFLSSIVFDDLTSAIGFFMFSSVIISHCDCGITAMVGLISISNHEFLIGPYNVAI